MLRKIGILSVLFCLLGTLQSRADLTIRAIEPNVDFRITISSLDVKENEPVKIVVEYTPSFSGKVKFSFRSLRWNQIMETRYRLIEGDTSQYFKIETGKPMRKELVILFPQSGYCKMRFILMDTPYEVGGEKGFITTPEFEIYVGGGVEPSAAAYSNKGAWEVCKRYVNDSTMSIRDRWDYATYNVGNVLANMAKEPSLEEKMKRWADQDAEFQAYMRHRYTEVYPRRNDSLVRMYQSRIDSMEELLRYPDQAPEKLPGYLRMREEARRIQALRKTIHGDKCGVLLERVISGERVEGVKFSFDLTGVVDFQISGATYGFVDNIDLNQKTFNFRANVVEDTTYNCISYQCIRNGQPENGKLGHIEILPRDTVSFSVPRDTLSLRIKSVPLRYLRGIQAAIPGGMVPALPPASLVRMDTETDMDTDIIIAYSWKDKYADFRNRCTNEKRTKPGLIGGIQ